MVGEIIVTRKSVLLITGTLCSLLMINPAHAAMGDVVLSFNAVANNTTGLTWVEGYLWNIGHGHYVPAELHKLDPTDGTELLKYTLPIQHVMGLTWDGSAFWAVSHEDSIIYQLYANNGSIMKSFPSPNPGTVETGCAGLAWDGQYLWYADNELDMIYKLDPVDGTQIHSFPSPGGKPEGLTWDGAYLWHFDLNTNLIYQLDPTDGSVQNSFSAPGNGEGDLAWDGTYLWLSRNSADRIYKIEITPPGIPVAKAGKVQPVFEGEPAQFDGSASYDPDGFITTFEWDFDTKVDSDGDGDPANDVDATGPIQTHIYGDNGVYNVILRVIDNESYSDIDNCVVVVNNLAPTIEPFGPLAVNESVLLTPNANATDPGSDDLTFTWNWGDGTSDTVQLYYNDGLGADPFPSPWGTYPFTINDFVSHVYYDEGIFTMNLTVEDDDGGVAYYETQVTVNNIPILPPTPYINVSQNKEDMILTWDPPVATDLNHYLIYRSTSQTDFDFNLVWMNTSKDLCGFETVPSPLRTNWTDSQAAKPGDDNYEKEYYYIIMAVNDDGDVSYTSRTVGKYTRVFPGGISSFSLPLQPHGFMDSNSLAIQMGADYIRYLNLTSHNWDRHDPCKGAVNNTKMKLGDGFEIKLQSETTFTFCGMPAAMILYRDASFGFNVTPGGDAGELTASVSSVSETVVLSWQPVAGFGSLDQYMVLRSTTRDGFWGTLGVDFVELAILPYNVLCYLDEGNATANSQLYYMIVPINSSTLEHGSSSYSIGIWTEEYLSEYDTLGIPLKLSNYLTADWYCDNIPGTVGINYYIYDEQRWCWHSTMMPTGAFDVILEMAEGYQISTSGGTRFTYIGI